MTHLKGWISAVSVIGTLIVVLQNPLPVYGSGFGIFSQGASAQGQGNSVVAHTDGPSTIFFNPALMNGLPGTQIEIGTTLVFPSRDFKSASTGNTASTEDNLYYPSTFYVTHTFNDKISAGLGVFNPFGLGSEWNGNWEGRYIATKSTLTTFNVNPAVSYKITPDLSFAAGLDVIVLDASLESKVNLSASGLPDANQKFKGDGTGVGYNLGIAYKAGHGISLGVSFRSEVDVDVKGDLSFDLPSPLLAGVLPNTEGKTTIKLPQQLYTGIAYQANDRLTVETGFRWEDWGSFNELKVELNQPIGVPQRTTIVSQRDWHDTFAVNVGGKYRINDTFTLLGGYFFGWNAVPDDTLEPAIPDANSHAFCLGTDMTFSKNVTLSMSYAYQFQEERKKNNSVGLAEGGTANGTYNADTHLLGLSAKYQF